MGQSTTTHVKCQCGNEFDATFYHADPPADPSVVVRAEPPMCVNCKTPVVLAQAPPPEPESKRDEGKFEQEQEPKL